MAFLLIIFLALVGVGGDWLLKLAGEGGQMRPWLFALGVLIYASTAIGWYIAFQRVKMGTLGVVYGVVTALALAVIGIVFFREQLRATESIGIGLGVVSIVLLARFA